LPIVLTLSGCGEGTGDARAMAGPGSAESGAVRAEASKAGMERAESAVIIEVPDASVLDEPGGVSDAKAFFSYVDERGGDHLVQGLHNVPPAHQALAKNLSNGVVRRINRYDGASVSKLALLRSRRSGSNFNPNRLDITVFSATWCGACRRTREFLDAEGVDYTLRDIDEDPSAKAEVRRILGSVRIPLIDINGTYVTGYDRKTLKKLIRGG
jgi:glutaredoxin